MDTKKFRCTKTSKEKPIMKDRLLQKITNGFFRLLEKIVVLVFILKLIFKISMALESSFEQYKGLVTVIGGRHSVFVIGNVIIVALLIKSGRLSSRESNSNASTDCIYEEVLANAERSRGIVRPEPSLTGKRDEQSTASMKQKQDRCENLVEQVLSETREKPVICESKVKPDLSEMREKQGLRENKTKHCPTEIRVRPSATETRTKESRRKNLKEQSSPESKIYRRTHSEKLLTLCDDSYGKLRRSETKKFPKTVKSDERIRKHWYPEDNMSETEFLSKIEAFIARQRRFQLDEECCSC